MDSSSIFQRIASLVGLFVMVGVAWACSKNRRAVPWRVIGWGLSLQLSFGVLVLKVPAGRWVFEKANTVLLTLLGFTDAGSRFVFGALMDTGFSLALNVLPTIIFFSSLMAVAYHLGIMQRIVQGLAWVMERTMRTTGAESLVAAANVFVGQTEAPLLIRPFLSKITHSELMAVMTAGLASVSGGILAAYVGVLRGSFPDIAGHLLAASVMSAPAALVAAKVMVPDGSEDVDAETSSTDAPRPRNDDGATDDSVDANVIDAAARGASEGLKLALNVAAMLLAFIALVRMCNYVLALPALWHNDGVWSEIAARLSATSTPLPEGCAFQAEATDLARCIHAAGETAWNPWTLERVLGWVFWPFAFAMGIPAAECAYAGQLLGEKIILNELVAYTHFGEALHGGLQLSLRTKVILSYALCGFANLGSIAILIGGIGALAPERRQEISRLGLRAVLAGSLAAFMTACVAGVLV